MWLWSYIYHVKCFDVWWYHHEYNKEQEIITPQQRRWFFLQRSKTTTFICFYWEKGTYEFLDVPCVYLHITIKNMKHYLTHILKSNTSSGDMNEKVYHWFDYLENSHNNYIIMPLESLNSSFLEESLFITVWSPPGFINRGNEKYVILMQPSRCYILMLFLGNV